VAASRGEMEIQRKIVEDISAPGRAYRTLEEA
jgi:hypothetical protein